MKKNMSGFTLIELLVVISIIALLVSILMPALNKARQQATASVCLANTKSLMQGYIMYVDDNFGKLPGGFVARSTDNYVDPATGKSQKHKSQWVLSPRADDGTPKDTPSANNFASLEDRINGIKAGSLWKYIKNHEVYNCPGDPRQRKSISSNKSSHDLNYRIYRSYSVPDCLVGGEQCAEPYVRGYEVKTYSSIKHPSQKYCFIEVADPGDAYFNFNHGGWSFDPWNGSSFWDPLAPFHNKSGIFSFLDGHSERHTWEHKDTVEFCEAGVYGNQWHNFIPPKRTGDDYSNQDVFWLVNGWAGNMPNKLGY